MPLAGLHEVAKREAEATVNDAVLACVAGGIRRWLEARHGPLGELRVKVPVSLHRPGEDAGNRDSFFVVALPLGVADPLERLRAIHSETAARKADHDAQELDRMMAAFSRASPHLERFAERIEDNPRRFALNVSNVPGPRGAVSVLGAPVSGIFSLAEIGERHALRVAVVSYAGDLCFGLCGDPDVVPDLTGLAAGITAEAERIAAATS
jgi:WS/DGAT/MGAT family acyltransferase